MKLLLAFWTLSGVLAAQEIPSRWDELTASDWAKAQEKAAYTCILPIGILEKHGPHVPLGSDLIQVREWSARAISAVKSDARALELQREYFDRVDQFGTNAPKR
jgi:creatinine amidohydrolase